MGTKALASVGIALLALGFAAEAGQATCNRACLVTKAMAGDGKVALQLADLSLKTSHEAMVDWYRIAAENGDGTGQYNYGVFLVADSKGKADCVRALFWFEKAARQGEKLADDYIGPLRKRLASNALDRGCINII